MLHVGPQMVFHVLLQWCFMWGSHGRCFTWNPWAGFTCGGPAAGCFTWWRGRCLLLFRRWADVHCGSRGRVLDVALIWCSSGLVVLCGSRGQVSRHGPSTPGAVKASSALGSAAGNYNPAIYR